MIRIKNDILTFIMKLEDELYFFDNGMPDYVSFSDGMSLMVENECTGVFLDKWAGGGIIRKDDIAQWHIENHAIGILFKDGKIKPVCSAKGYYTVDMMDLPGYISNGWRMVMRETN